MKRQLMVAASLAAFVTPLAVPLAASAQDAEVMQERALREQRNDRMERLAERRERAAPSQAPSSPPSSSGEARQDRGPDRPSRDASQDRPRGDRPAQDRPSQDRPSQDRPSQDRPRAERPDDRGGRTDRDGRQDGGWSRDRNGDGRQDQRDRDRNSGGWSQNRDGRDQDRWSSNRDRQRQHDQFRRDFDSDRWRRDWNRSHRSDWWRNDRRFRSFTGVRLGFYFAPGYGYYNVPRSYYGRQWGPGEYLPSIFWRYQLNDWRDYGLGMPPIGTRWVWVDNSIYLIDSFDGYIIDVVWNAWRW